MMLQGGNMENYYQVLSVHKTATQEEIRKRYLFLVKAYHPDRFSSREEKAAAEEDMKRINSAYATLSDPVKRSQYDKALQSDDEAKKVEDVESDDERLINAATDYLVELSDRWNYLVIKHSDDFVQETLKRQLYSNVEILLKKLRINSNTQEFNKLQHDFNSMMVLFTVFNLSMGMENFARGLSKDYDYILLIGLTQIHIRIFVKKLIDDTIRSGSITVAEGKEYLGSVNERLEKLCISYQQAGEKLLKIDQQSQYTSKNEQQDQPINHQSITRCESCNTATQTRNLTFRQNIGVIICRFHKKASGNMCAACAEHYFWQFTGITLLLGWWGMISFIVTPVFLLANLYNYVQVWPIRGYSSGLAKIGVVWKFIVGIILTLVLINILVIITSSSSTSVAHISPTVSSFEVTQITSTQRSSNNTISSLPTSTYIPITKPTNTPEPCYRWDQVNFDMAGEDLCVYGIVSKSYFIDDVFHIWFSESTSDFFIIVLDQYYFEGIDNNCVMAEGIIKTNNVAPYMEVTDLYKCDE